VKPFSLKILYLYQLSKNYYFELIASKAVPKEVVLLQETIGIFIIFDNFFKVSCELILLSFLPISLIK